MAYYISQGKVETPIRRGKQFRCSFVANLLRYLCAKNYQNRLRFDKVIAKTEGCIFFASQCSYYYDLNQALCAMIQDGFGKCRSILDIHNTLYWVSMLYNGQRILLFTADQAFATRVFHVWAVLSYELSSSVWFMHWWYIIVVSFYWSFYCMIRSVNLYSTRSSTVTERPCDALCHWV